MQEFQKSISGKKVEIIFIKILVNELKEGSPEPDENYLIQELAELDNTVAALMKGYIKIERELVESLKFSSTFYDKLQKTVANVKEKKKELENIHSGKLKLDELNVILL